MGHLSVCGFQGSARKAALKGKRARPMPPSHLPSPRVAGQQNMSVWSGGWSGRPENQRLMGQIRAEGIDFCSLTTRASDAQPSCGLRQQRKVHPHHTCSRIGRIFHQVAFSMSSVFWIFCQYS